VVARRVADEDDAVRVDRGSRDLRALAPRADLGLLVWGAVRLVKRDHVAVARAVEDLALADRDARLAAAGADVEAGLEGRRVLPERCAGRGIQRERLPLRGREVVRALIDDCVRLERTARSVLRTCRAGAEVDLPRPLAGCAARS